MNGKTNESHFQIDDGVKAARSYQTSSATLSNMGKYIQF